MRRKEFVYLMAIGSAENRPTSPQKERCAGCDASSLLCLLIAGGFRRAVPPVASTSMLCMEKSVSVHALPSIGSTATNTGAGADFSLSSGMPRRFGSSAFSSGLALGYSLDVTGVLALAFTRGVLGSLPTQRHSHSSANPRTVRLGNVAEFAYAWD